EIIRQLNNYQETTLKSASKWEWMSIFAAFVAFVFLAYAGFFMIQWREPLTYLSTLPALIAGICAPLIHNHYKQQVEQVNKQYTDALEQLNHIESESDQRKEAMFGTILNDVQYVPGLVSE